MDVALDFAMQWAVAGGWVLTSCVPHRLCDLERSGMSHCSRIGLGRAHLQLRGWGVSTALWLDPPPPKKTAQLTGTPKPYR